MNDSGERPDVLLSTVVKRAGFLTALASGPIPKRHLRDELDVSRSTVYKAVRELHEYELVERTDEGLALTLAGGCSNPSTARFEASPRTSIEPENCSRFSERFEGVHRTRRRRHDDFRRTTRTEPSSPIFRGDGFRCRPGVGYLARRTSAVRRTVSRPHRR
ncbi:GntR family transcriptional regulator [Haladaptatus sp. W1]|uniref:GntR family transcriptional regulator n=1 Tax=Haladaptatus sp. W1 TaxID=1897478 RepID=UPI0009F6CD68|nr:GntR family transcriptional regulator [Haladaptatus sp. W1]